jgi:hypothetical protein
MQLLLSKVSKPLPGVDRRDPSSESTAAGLVNVAWVTGTGDELLGMLA